MKQIFAQLFIFLKKFWWILLILLTVILVFSFINNGKDKGGNFIQKNISNIFSIWPDPSSKYITAVPVDLTQIQSISKYGSCAGHIRDGYDFNQVREYDSSMKHYLYPISEFQGTMDKVKLFAPFDGTVVALYWEKDKVNPNRSKNGNGIDLSTSVDKNVVFGFGHLYFARDFKVGDKVKAGELIGYASLVDKGNDFDIDLKGKQKTNEDVEILGSAFDHMTDAVLAEFAKYGVTPDNTKVSLEDRKADPCNYPNVSEVHNGRNTLDWVFLTGQK